MLDSQADLAEVIRTARQHGVQCMITIGIDLPSSQRAVELAQEYPEVYATVGIHPHAAQTATPEIYAHLRTLAKAPKVVGFGEIGLDYVKQYAPVDVQRQAFAEQLDLAKQLHLPLVIHDREAHEDTLDLLEQKGPFPQGGVMHCFSGDLALAQQVLALGLHLSIPGVVTFNKASAMQEVAQKIPLEYLLVETDAPFLAPVPFRGKSNRPEYLLYTAAKIATLRGLSLDQLARQTTHNAQTLFGLTSEVLP
jgi:TatD DNase family protein